MAPVCHIITYIILALHPPYPVLVVANAISGFGNGLTDACFCAWVGAMDKANTIQGFLHSFYSVGALVSPLIATSMVVKAELPWYNYYYLMVRNITQGITRACSSSIFRLACPCLSGSALLSPFGKRLAQSTARSTRERIKTAGRAPELPLSRRSPGSAPYFSSHIWVSKV